MKCFYHSADLDGKCSAAIVRRRHPEFELIPIDYGQPFPWESLARNEIVIMVDFSLQPFSDMERLREVAGIFVWIDHHQTALNEAERAGWRTDSPDEDVFGIRRIGIGACALTWEFFFPNEPMPRAVRLLAEYDVWDHHDPECLAFQAGMGLQDCDPVGLPGSVDWVRLLEPENEDDSRWQREYLPNIIEEGKLILKYKKIQNEGHAKTLLRGSRP